MQCQTCLGRLFLELLAPSLLALLPHISFGHGCCWSRLPRGVLLRDHIWPVERAFVALRQFLLLRLWLLEYESSKANKANRSPVGGGVDTEVADRWERQAMVRNRCLGLHGAWKGVDDTRMTVCATARRDCNARKLGDNLFRRELGSTLVLGPVGSFEQPLGIIAQSPWVEVDHERGIAFLASSHES